jgi:hypothetical protein
MDNKNEKELLDKLKQTASNQIREGILNAMVDSGLTPNQCSLLCFIYLGNVENIYKLYNSYSDKKRYVNEMNELFELAYIDSKLKRDEMGDLVDIMPKSEILCERILGISFRRDLMELGEELKNAYPRKGYTLTKIDNMDMFCRKYAQKLMKSSDKLKIDVIELHKKIVNVVKTNDINMKITNFVESAEWEAYLNKEQPKKSKYDI